MVVRVAPMLNWSNEACSCARLDRTDDAAATTPVMETLTVAPTTGVESRLPPDMLVFASSASKNEFELSSDVTLCTSTGSSPSEEICRVKLYVEAGGAGGEGGAGSGDGG